MSLHPQTSLAKLRDLAELRRADAAALAEFAEATYVDLFRWFHWLTGDEHGAAEHGAADLTQATFAEFWASLAKRPSSESAATAEARVWLFAIGRNVWRKKCRQRKANQHEALAEQDCAKISNNGHASLDSPAGQLITTEENEAIRNAVANLPEELREAITLRYWQDMSYGQIATVLGTTENNARQRVHQARNKLRSQLKFLISDQDFAREAKP